MITCSSKLYCIRVDMLRSHMYRALSFALMSVFVFVFVFVFVYRVQHWLFCFITIKNAYGAKRQQRTKDMQKCNKIIKITKHKPTIYKAPNTVLLYYTVYTAINMQKQVRQLHTNETRIKTKLKRKKKQNKCPQ